MNKDDNKKVLDPKKKKKKKKINKIISIVVPIIIIVAVLLILTFLVFLKEDEGSTGSGSFDPFAGCIPITEFNIFRGIISIGKSNTTNEYILGNFFSVAGGSNRIVSIENSSILLYDVINKSNFGNVTWNLSQTFNNEFNNDPKPSVLGIRSLIGIGFDPKVFCFTKTSPNISESVITVKIQNGLIYDSVNLKPFSAPYLLFGYNVTMSYLNNFIVVCSIGSLTNNLWIIDIYQRTGNLVWTSVRLAFQSTLKNLFAITNNTGLFLFVSDFINSSVIIYRREAILAELKQFQEIFNPEDIPNDFGYYMVFTETRLFGNILAISYPKGNKGFGGVAIYVKQLENPFFIRTQLIDTNPTNLSLKNIGKNLVFTQPCGRYLYISAEMDNKDDNDNVILVYFQSDLGTFIFKSVIINNLQKNSSFGKNFSCTSSSSPLGIISLITGSPSFLNNKGLFSFNTTFFN